MSNDGFRRLARTVIEFAITDITHPCTAYRDVYSASALFENLQWLTFWCELGGIPVDSVLLMYRSAQEERYERQKATR